MNFVVPGAARAVETPLGPVVMWGRDTGRPILLILHGAFAIIDQLEPVQGYLPDVDVWRVHLPGNHCPPLSATSVGAFGFAASHALRSVAAGRKLSVVGLSAGALVALAMDQEPIDRLILVEPPLWPAACWPLRDFQRNMPPGGEAFVWAFFGVSRNGVEPRDYRALLDRLRKPALVLVGDQPLEPERVLPHWPSLVDTASRELLAAHPLVELRVIVGAGHHFIRDAPGPFLAALRALA